MGWFEFKFTVRQPREDVEQTDGFTRQEPQNLVRGRDADG